MKKILPLIESIEYPVINSLEIKELITSIKNIRGFKTKSRDFIKKYLLNEYLSQENLDRFDIYLLKNKKNDIYDIASTRSRKAFFSFHTALSIHNLILNQPKQIYLTLERPTFVKSLSNLEQSTIDEVFSKPAKTTNNKRTYTIYSITLINGQHQNNIGIIPFRNYKVSDIERTLIDICVRPFYSGGVSQVLSIFNEVKSTMDTEKLFEYYRNMNFIYPYHQIIGFYLDKSGYPKESYEKFLSLRTDIKFYITYNILHKNFSEKWNLYYPMGM
ncbi:type IV toxin-antitoxin system AbiEi family antitoxin domain-containing protein [Riemerella anatipestifer]|uniref:AbiEi antitoxin C-terminal domain-containing protein n=1 Tax=Riemerella anatipestifer TaxID=34085 RepID=E5D2K2_RIEAN|nr:hypothetical protein [Riemerella anatipestifer]ADD83112.1 hypothetical protein [Riemerella anatipestifer]AEM66525.1 hypothetical protein [Riemerella anatipestifer]AEM66535.1 hypothetical protein [Riemerella anatipestifer]MBT0554884.1 hypothetical protein [Riemerella anatipestifer]MBT0563182.1 hypothetical protein [Riemerella anatipestifer]